MVKDDPQVQKANAVQQAEDSEPEGSEVSYGSDEPHESYQSDAESSQGKPIPLHLSFLTLNQSMAVEQLSHINGVWHCLSTLLPAHNITQLVAHFCPCVCSCNRNFAVPWACLHVVPTLRLLFGLYSVSHSTYRLQVSPGLLF